MTNDGGHGLIPIPQTVVYRVWLAHNSMKLGLLSSSVIVAVAVSAAPIITILPGVAVNMAVNISVFSSIPSFTTVTFTICTDSSGAKVTTVLVCPVKSSGSEGIINSGMTVASQLDHVHCKMCYLWQCQVKC